MPVGLAAGSLRMHTGTQPGRPLAMHPALNVWGVLDLAKAWGFDGLMLSVDQIPSPDPTLLARVRDRAAALHLFLEIELRYAQLGEIAAWLHAAQILGASCIRIVVAPFGNGERWKFDGDARAYFTGLARTLASVGREARNYGVLLAIENHMDFTLDEYEFLFHLLDPEAFGVCLDTGNPLGTVELPETVCQVLAPRTVTTHIKDYLPVWVRDGYRLLTRPIGEGVIDWAGIATEVLRCRPNVHLNLEVPVFSVREIPVFRPEFWSAYGPRTAAECARVLARVHAAASNRPAEIRNGLELGWSEEDLLIAEEQYFRTSLARVRAWDAGRTRYEERASHGR